MDEKELSVRLGEEVVKTYRVENHDARSQGLVVMGELPAYGKISFNATVMKADVKIIVGTIIPHVHNGFGGGPKNIMPAICNFETIRKHHLKTALDAKARVWDRGGESVSGRSDRHCSVGPNKLCRAVPQ